MDPEPGKRSVKEILVGTYDMKYLCMVRSKGGPLHVGNLRAARVLILPLQALTAS